MKKITFLFALLCASVMGFAFNENVKFPDAGTYAQQFYWTSIGGVTAPMGVNSVESKSGFDCIYINVGQADFDPDDGIIGCELAAYEGAGVWVKISSLNSADNEIYFKNSGGTTLRGLVIHNIAEGAAEPSSGSDPAPTYCNMEIGHMSDPSADPNSFILLSVGSDGNGHTIVNIKQDNAKNSVMFDYINIVGKKEIGTDVATGGSDEMAIVFNTPTPDGDGNITFTLQWSTVGWGGRWQINDVTVPADATCASADPFPGTNAYCKYTDSQMRAGNANVALTWSTDASGNVVIDISDGDGATNSAFRNGGFENDGSFANSWKIYSGTKHSVVESADVYFNAGVLSNENKRFTLEKKATLPANAVVAFFGHAFSWRTDQATGAYQLNKWFGYDYGYSCPFLAAPTNVAVDGTNHITFDGVANAQTYTASVYLNGILKHRQVVSSGDALTFQPYTTGTYQVQVVADASGYPTSDPSEAYDWELTAPSIVVGNSEYCEWALPKHNNQDANLTWETGDDGAITITLSPLSEQTAVFRAEGMKLSDFTVGAARTAASAYFNRSYTAGGTTVVLTLKDANIAPGLGEKIYFSGYIECKVQNQDTWPNPSLEYTYGSKCSGQKHVTVSVNNNEMGSATVDGVAAKDVDEGTQVTCVAVPASGYEFVNWTKGGVEVSTDLTYTPTINTATDLVANFDYVRTTYCHQAVTTNGGKKLYLTVGKGATEGTYQIKIYGSEELTITGINLANTAINHVKYLTYDGNDVPLTVANGGWTYSSEGYGIITSAELRPQTNHTWRDMWMWRPDLFIGTSAGEQNINATLDNEHYFNWDNDCADAAAPVFTKAVAEVLDESSVRLKIQATDNWEGLLTYTIARAGAEPIISNHASGEEFTQDVTGLTAGTEYDFTVTVSDGVNNANTHIVVTPVADDTKPYNVAASLVSKTWNTAIISVAADDDFDAEITKFRVVNATPAINHVYVASEGKITVTDLEANTDYNFTITALDAADNESELGASVAFKTLLAGPTAACDNPTWPADQVKAIYSPTYSADCNFGYWDSGTAYTQEAYGKKFVTAGSGYFGLEFINHLNCVNMEKLHLDIWIAEDASIGIVPIWGGEDVRAYAELTGQQWNSVDLDLSTDYAGVTDWSDVYQLKIDNAANLTFWIANVYFYRESAYVDTEAPTDFTASLAEESYFSVKINAQASDNSGAVTFTVKNGETVVATQNAVSAAAAVINVTGLNAGTAYNFDVYVADEAGNTIAPIAVAATTKVLPGAAPVPTLPADRVKSIYSETYTTAITGGINFNEWWWQSPTIAQEVSLGGNNARYYSGLNTNGSFGITWSADNKLDAAGYQIVHFHIYPTNSATIEIYPVIAPEGEFHRTSQTLVGGQWNEVIIDFSDKTFAPFNQFGIVYTNALGDFFIDNLYFEKSPDLVRDDSWMAPGELGTICIPNGAVAEGGDIYQLVGKNSEGKIVFSTVDNNQMAPGVPYLFEAKSNAMKFYYTAEDAANEPDNSGAMKGTFNEVTLTGDQLTNVYYFAGRALWSCVDLTSTGLHVSANRAYVQMDKVEDITTPSSAPGRRYIIMGVNGENQTQGFENLESGDAPKKVMIEGTLYILLGEKVYDATGRLVK